MTNNCCNVIAYFDLESLEPEKNIQLNDVFYLTQVQGKLCNSKMKCFFGDVISILKVTEPVSLRDVLSNQTIKVGNGVHIINGCYDIELTVNVQLVIIKLDFYQDIGLPIFSVGIHTHAYEHILLSIFDAILFSGKPEYALLALANLTGADESNRHVHNDYEKIQLSIVEFCKNHKFNLDLLCSKVHMSRRKIQYILSENNSSFVDLTQIYRLRELKKLINREPHVALIKLAERSGFRNIGMAKRAFSKHYGISLTSYKRKMNKY